jgi:hypothetical protein
MRALMGIDLIERFVRPLYQDLDGVTRFDAVERVTAIARRLAPPSRELDLLLLFHGLGPWLDKVGNRSRTTLATGLTEAELRGIDSSIRRLGTPVTQVERAVAAALAIDGAGVRGLVERLARSRRDGMSVEDVARAGLTHEEVPSWMPPQAVVWINERIAARQDVCRKVFEETGRKGEE